MRNIFILSLLALFVASAFAYSDDACIYGTVVWSDGSKSDGTSTISTSWNSKKAFPRDGKYRLCLGSNPKTTITVYVNGMKYTDLYVDGDKELNIVIR